MKHRAQVAGPGVARSRIPVPLFLSRPPPTAGQRAVSYAFLPVRLTGYRRCAPSRGQYSKTVLDAQWGPRRRGEIETDRVLALRPSDRVSRRPRTTIMAAGSGVVKKNDFHGFYLRPSLPWGYDDDDCKRGSRKLSEKGLLTADLSVSGVVVYFNFLLEEKRNRCVRACNRK
ncbi:hypothetical protein H6P81_000612 [Aristolochia fimbriata]|uniref:Uncharacterized protein n=1 Tax=Aristolochia fimbriata TaxID=158543 RepID=A0AAV7F5F9_ARIFI|nr:hypothetical protein H6P81_000612 [Aristolochia fimbriata]